MSPFVVHSATSTTCHSKTKELQKTQRGIYSFSHQRRGVGESYQLQIPAHTHLPDLTWTVNIPFLVRKAQQRLCFFRTLQKANLSQQQLLSCCWDRLAFWEHTHIIAFWCGYAGCTAVDKKDLRE